MSILIDTKHRVDTAEIMDDFSIGGDELKNTLNQLANINKWLGGNHITLNGLKKLLKAYPKKEQYTIIDVGCGNGDMLRRVARYGKKHGFNFKLIGVDANEHAIDFAREQSTDFQEITYLQQDIFSDDFKLMSYDIILSTLFLHHFKNQEIEHLLKNMLSKATMGIIINDLHRHFLAYYLFKLLGITIKNEMVKQDGLTSILRAFKRSEITKISDTLKSKSVVKWKWAFRYQWIIYK